MLTYIFLIAGFILLIKGANFLVDGSSSIAKKLKIPSIVIGLTVVAFGTSAPEFIVNIFASIKGTAEIAIGNVLGSNILNILLILGISSMIYPLAVKKNTVWKEIPLSLLAAILVGVLANDKLIDDGTFTGLTRIDGIVFLCFFILFLYYTFEISKIKEKSSENSRVKEFSYFKSTAYIIGGLAGLIIGGKLIVEAAVEIAASLNVSEALIGLTIVAAGTSLPELATSAVAAYKKQCDIAVGNIVGSNIFNVFWVLGVSAIIRPLPFGPDLNIDIVVTILASVILFLTMFIGRRHVLERWQGVLMVVVYIGYLVFLINRQ